MSQTTITEKRLILAFRIIISALFILSALSKLFPEIGFFEHLLYKKVGVAWSWGSAQVMSRAIITIELFIAFAVLQNSHFKKIIVPLTSLMLVAFTLQLFHWGFTSRDGFFTGNCGCFGDLLPMNAFESILKNVAMLGMLFYMYKKAPADKKGDPKLLIILLEGALIVILGASLSLKSYVEPDEGNGDIEVIEMTPIPETTIKEPETITDSATTTEDSTSTTSDVASTPEDGEGDGSGQTTVATPTPDPEPITPDPEPVTPIAPKEVKSKWAKYTSFSGGVTTNLDKGRKLVCLFSLTCEHCQECYKELCALGKTMNIPDIYMLCYGAQSDVPYFYEQAGADCKHPYKIIPFTEFIPLMGDYSFPMVFLMEDGKQLGMWHYDTYNIDEIKTAIKALK